MKTSVLSLVSLLLAAQFCFAQPPKDLRFTTTEQLNDPEYIQKIETFYERGEHGYLQGQESVKIYFKTFRQQEFKSDAIVVSSGRTEGAVKYKELCYDLFQNGYSVYILDHRGQGQSGRMNEDSEMGHVDDFANYVKDLKTFMDDQVLIADHDKVFLMAHSMGGTIGFGYLEDYPQDFDAAVFSSPMLGLASYICPLARILSGKKVKYAPGQTGYTNDSTKFEGNSVTGSVKRFMMKIDAYSRVPEAKVGGPSVQWLDESCRYMKKVWKNMEKITVPFILYAADNETVVNGKAGSKFIEKAKKRGLQCEEILVADAEHELLMEKDTPRNETLHSMLTFLKEQ